MVQYIQDYSETVGLDRKEGLSNLFLCPDEGFEADLDLNFEQAWGVLQKMGLKDITEDNYMTRPGQEDPN